MNPVHVYLAGELVPVRGVEMKTGETKDGDKYPKPFLHVQYPDKRTTRRVNLAAVKYQGGLSDLMDALYERGMLPEWYVNGESGPRETPS